MHSSTGASASHPTFWRSARRARLPRSLTRSTNDIPSSCKQEQEKWSPGASLRGMFSCRLGVLRAGDADEVRQHTPRVGALCVAEADGVGHRVRHAQHLQPAMRLRCQQLRRIPGAEAGAHAARAARCRWLRPARRSRACWPRATCICSRCARSCTVCCAGGGTPSPDLKTAPNVVQ